MLLFLGNENLDETSKASLQHLDLAENLPDTHNTVSPFFVDAEARRLVFA